MPNHVTNRLQFFGPAEQIERALLQLRSPKEPTVLVDFNQLLPMPEELRDTRSGSNAVLSDEAYADLLAGSKDGTRAGLNTGNPWSDGQHPISQSMARDFQRRFGATNWYDWATGPNGWGTKWGAYDTGQEGDHTLFYNTAWSSGNADLLKGFSDAFPQLVIVHDWADEDTGHNTGRRIWHEGDYDEELDEGGSETAYRRAFCLSRDRSEYRRTKPGSDYPYLWADSDDSNLDENNQEEVVSNELEKLDRQQCELFEQQLLLNPLA